MKIYEYKDKKDYIEHQLSKTDRHKDKIWISDDVIETICDYVDKSKIEFGICHGVRSGYEVTQFALHLDAKIIGTELSQILNKNVIQWDFNEIKGEWLNSVDFIYSNSWDHSNNPKVCLDNWMQCLSKTGLCCIEHSKYHEVFNEIDCFSATSKEYIVMFKDYDMEYIKMHDKRNTILFFLRNKQC